jgi:UDP-N-acetylmuramoyl-tripeptide--D-alanyl-D-alanine ligase
MKSLFKKIIVYTIILESRIILKKYKPYIVAVTGSVGKTSTKDAIFTALTGSGFIRKSEKSFNSDIGLPLTILGCQNGWNKISVWIKNIFVGLELIMFRSKYPECLVLEVGADHPGDIENIAKWLKPDITVITKISEIPVHVEFFPSPEAVLKEKMYLAKALKKDGTLIISSDDKKLVEASKDIKNNILTFGIDNKGTITAENIMMNVRDGIKFNINYDGNVLPVNIKGVLGKQQVYPILAGVMVGILRKMPVQNILESFKTYIAPRGRMNIINGIKESVIIDDSYNSSPDAVHEALSTLSILHTSGKKIAVLGDMMELGKFSAEEHRKVGEQAMKSCDILVTVGQRAKNISDKAVSFDDAVSAGEYVKSIIDKNDIVLIKGSQSTRMERVAKILILDQDKAEELLVRQEPEWLAKK